MKYLVKQLFEEESSTYTYFIIDKNSKEVVIIDPVEESFERDMEIIKQFHLQLKYPHNPP